jgi:anti-sigma regulatory factor (Ser/Thr protein kinase)
MESMRLVVEEQSQIAEARRIARGMAVVLGFGEDEAERVAIGVTEACTNLLKHAGGGELFLSVTREGSPEFEALALDRGPGIANIADCLRDGYSTGGSPGQGLGAIGRHGSKFGRKKEQAITALLTQRNVEEAARTAGIGTRTLIRWLKIPEFEAAYLAARRAAVSQSNARLQQGSSAAVSTLLKVMVDAGTPASTRVRAADCILGHAKQALEIDDIQVRLTALEQTKQPAKPPGRD